LFILLPNAQKAIELALEFNGEVSGFKQFEQLLASVYLPV
jgi:hypothetical protein